MLFAPSPAGAAVHDPVPLEAPSRLHAVLVLSTGEIDFDCPHVDARADGQPLFYDQEPLSVWVLADGGRERLEFGGLHDLTGSSLDPWPVLEQEIYLSDMLKRDEASLNILDLYLLTVREAVRRSASDALVPAALRVCCTRDLLVLDARGSDGSPLRPRLADLRGCLDPLATWLGDDDLVLPVFDRGVRSAQPGSPEALRRRFSVNAQMRALLEVVRAPHEILIDRRFCA